MTIEQFASGLLSVLSLLVLWFFSPLKITLGKLFLGRTFNTLTEFDDWLFLKNPTLGQLCSCWICCSFWLSLLVGYIIHMVWHAAWYAPFVAFFCYPSLAYLYYVWVKDR